MSDTFSQNKKVISIRKLEDFFEDNKKTTPLDAEENIQLLQVKIDRLKSEIASLEQQKEKVIDNLKRAIDKEKIAWEEQKIKEKEIAQETGYKIGYDAGEEAALNQYASLLEEANRIVHLANEAYVKTVEKYEDAIVQLAITAARKIIANEITSQPETFTLLIKQAIEELKETSNIEIYIHPKQYEHVLKHRDELNELVRKEDVISIYVNDKLNDGDCLIRNTYGQIDVSIDTQLQQLKIALEEFIAEKQQ